MFSCFGTMVSWAFAILALQWHVDGLRVNQLLEPKGAVGILHTLHQKKQRVLESRDAAPQGLEQLWRAAVQAAGLAAAAPMTLPLAAAATVVAASRPVAAPIGAQPALGTPQEAEELLEPSTSLSRHRIGASFTAGTLAAGTLAAGTAMSTPVVMDPDAGVEADELVLRRGYPLERHRIITADDYILNMFRIPHGRLENGQELSSTPWGQRKPAVLLQHGLFDSSLAWVANFPEQSLAYILADAGFDVWLGNNRGTRYSRNHVRISPLSKHFWNFSWTEMAEFDLPAEVEYVLHHTGAKRLAYVGHSEGTIQAFAAFTSNSTLASKVSVFVALAPTAYTAHQRVLLFNVAQKFGMHKVLQVFGDGFFSWTSQQINGILSTGCRVITEGCTWMADVIAGRSVHLNETRLHVYANMFPEGTSTKNVVHWVNSFGSKAFAKYDYGSKDNMRAYGSPTPPAYNLSNLTVPTAFFSGGHDQLADPKDVQRLLREVRPGIVFKFKQVPTYGHLDFLYASDANTLIFPEVLTALNEHLP